MLAPAPFPFAVLVSDSANPCGVEAFARLLAEKTCPAARTLRLGPATAELFKALGACGALVVNLPVVAWKRRVATLPAVVAAARLRGARVILILHEWDDLDWKRRLSYRPLIALAHHVLFSCPEVAAQFRRSFPRFAEHGLEYLVPIPPNLSRPALTIGGPARAALVAEHGRGRLIIGQFGSIYPKKQPTAVLEVAAELLARGADPFVVFVGSFIEARDGVKDVFDDQVRRLGLTGRVLVTGYVVSDAELFGLFEEIDVFIYAFAEGLTARRGSVYACLLSGTPVVVNAPRDPTAFDHHPAYRMALASRQLHLTRHDPTVQDTADAVMAMHGMPSTTSVIDARPAWDAAVQVVEAAVRR